tara:strand:+ start:4903 stop:6669 length:1767 start_codon:yes stop_codon:yes gene_type:complete
MAGGNLSPRQKMINMMYLVLTALLALNVSKEVLNSFFEVNKGIERTTTNFNLKNSKVYAEFQNAANNNAVKYQKVADQAFFIRDKADALVDTLQKMKYDLVLAVDNEVYLGSDKDFRDKEGKLIDEAAIKVSWNKLGDLDKKKDVGYLAAKSNREKSGQLFYNIKAAKTGKEQKATIMKSEMEAFRDTILFYSQGNSLLQSSFSKTFEFSDRKLDNGKGKSVNWEYYNFHDMPAVSALTLLSKMQSDIRNAEANVIDHLKKDIDSKSLKFGDAEGVAIPEAQFILRGDSFRAEIFIAGQQKGQEPTIFVGAYDSIGDGEYKMRGTEGVDYEKVRVIGGKGRYATRTSSEGSQIWGGLITMKTEQGDKIYPFEGEYLVASKQAVVSPTNMAVLYQNIPNPIKVSVAGYSASQISATTRNGKIKVVSKGKGEYVVTPTKLTREPVPIIDLSVMDKGVRKKMGSVSFKVSEVPDPYPKVPKIPDNTTRVSRAQLKSGQMLQAKMKNFPFNEEALSFYVRSFTVDAYKADGSRFLIKPQDKTKGRFSQEVLDAIDVTPSGGTISFKNIIAKQVGVKNAPDRPLQGALIFTIK